MAEWIPIATTAALLLLLLLLVLVLVKQNSISSEQAEINRVLGLLVDTVEFQTESAQRRMESRSDETSDDRPSIIEYQKPKLTVEPKSKPPPPPPAKLKRW
jgi:hypothetical protein